MHRDMNARFEPNAVQQIKRSSLYPRQSTALQMQRILVLSAAEYISTDITKPTLSAAEYSSTSPFPSTADIFHLSGLAFPVSMQGREPLLRCL
jgi:hypothetical protein